MTENRFGLKGVNASIELGNGKTGSYGGFPIRPTADRGRITAGNRRNGQRKSFHGLGIKSGWNTIAFGRG